jgi:hypothetical protein
VSRYICFTNLKHLIFKNGGSIIFWMTTRSHSDQVPVYSTVPVWRGSPPSPQNYLIDILVSDILSADTGNLKLHWLFFAVLLGPSSDACSGNSCIRAFATEQFEFLSKKIYGAYLCPMIDLGKQRWWIKHMISFHIYSFCLEK